MLQDTYPLQILIDSGADDNFIDSGIISKLSIPTVELANSKEVLALDGRLLAEVTHRTAPITLTISGNHQETVELFVISSPLSPVVLGLPWLKVHNPQIDWATVSITGWSNHCHSHCLGSAKTAFSSPSPAEEVNISSVPSEYHDLKLVFSKDRALSLPPHRPYDCAIELLPGAPLPTKNCTTSPGRRKRPWRSILVNPCPLASFVLLPHLWEWVFSLWTKKTSPCALVLTSKV